jgi:hypothetical protein
MGSKAFGPDDKLIFDFLKNWYSIWHVKVVLPVKYHLQ